MFACPLIEPPLDDFPASYNGHSKTEDNQEEPQLMMKLLQVPKLGKHAEAKAAFDAGASVCSIIPTRGGNGAMERIGAAAPTLASLEWVLEYGVAIGRGRVFADLWALERFDSCRCSPERRARLRVINETQRIPAPILCDCATRG